MLGGFGEDVGEGVEDVEAGEDGGGVECERHFGGDLRVFISWGRVVWLMLLFEGEEMRLKICCECTRDPKRTAYTYLIYLPGVVTQLTLYSAQSRRMNVVDHAFVSCFHRL